MTTIQVANLPRHGSDCDCGLCTYSEAHDQLDVRWREQEQQRAFIDVCRKRNLHAVFQPILDFHTRQYMGFEGLVRSPQNSPLNDVDLLAMAGKMGLQAEFENVCRNIVTARFAGTQLPGRLFLNSSVSYLTASGFIADDMLQLLEKLDMHPSQVVIELHEDQVLKEFNGGSGVSPHLQTVLQKVLDRHRQLGYRIAIDNFGEGFANMHIWLEILPDFIKIDRYFIADIAANGIKFHLVRAIRDLAEACHVHLIANGIETTDELTVVRDLGISYGQGLIIAKPEEAPAFDFGLSLISAVLQHNDLIVFPQISAPTDGTARTLLNPVEPLSVDCDNDEVFRRFEQDNNLLVLPVVDQDYKPLGLINRYTLIDRFVRPFHKELFGKKSCTLFMDKNSIIVDQNTSIHDVSRRLSQAAHHHIMDGFIITAYGHYVGIGSSQAVMAVITDAQISTARYANPLTQLPGNVPINEHIDRLLVSMTDFVACYCDLDHFKPYNDIYGYRRGDDLIQFLGRLLVSICDTKRDFVGHIGGDDFMVLMQSADWQQRITKGIAIFEENIGTFLEELHVQAGGYYGEDRQGKPVFHPLPSVSIGCLDINPALFRSHHEVAAAVTEAKKQAKKIAGSSLFIERRKVSPKT